MHIINAMFSCELGGIEQSFVDYCVAIKNQKHKVTAIIHPDAKIRPYLVNVGVNIVNVKNIGEWDPFAKNYLKKILKQTKPDAIIAHGKRATELMKYPAKSVACPLISVTHNYKIKKQIGLDAIFATTEDLKQRILKAGQREESIYRIPNMIKLPQNVPLAKQFHNPPIIGAMGRFVKKKGFDNFINAIHILKQQGVQLQAMIGGCGEENDALVDLVQSLGLNETIKFSGWVDNKEQFFENIDIFCLPSLHEPFGIILLEAFMSGKAVITTDAEGPSEIATSGKDALIVPKADSEKMAAAIKKLIENEELAHNLAQEGFNTVKSYSIENIGVKINVALEEIVG
jgi:glycosyltransferase involved in cell wall biosynthesis